MWYNYLYDIYKKQRLIINLKRFDNTQKVMVDEHYDLILPLMIDKMIYATEIDSHYTPQFLFNDLTLNFVLMFYLIIIVILFIIVYIFNLGNISLM